MLNTTKFFVSLLRINITVVISNDYAVKVLQNTSICDGKKEKPTIKITESSLEWESAYTLWKQQKNPTNSNEWKKGIYLHYKKGIAHWLWNYAKNLFQKLISKIKVK